MKLGERLHAIAAMVPYGARLADIGTDHAYLPIYLAANNIIETAVAVDVNPGPYISACEAVAQSGLANLIDVRRGDGLKVVAPGEVDTVVIAGMGGITMIQVMEDSPAVLAGLKRLILQPMVAVPQVRRWLQSYGWRIIDETIVEDEGRLYELLVAEPGCMQETELLEIGPVLWAKRHPLLMRIVEQRLQTLYHITEQMEKSLSGQNSPKYLKHKAVILDLEARLAWLQSANR